MKTKNRPFMALVAMFVAALVVALVPVSFGAQPGVVATVQNVRGPVNATQAFIDGVVGSLSMGLAPPNTLPGTTHITNLFSSEGNGYAVYSTLSITSTVPFTLASIRWEYQSPFGHFVSTFGEAGASFTGQGVGYDLLGNRITSGNADTLVTSIKVIGFSGTIDYTGMSLDEAQAAWGPATPFTERNSYFLRDTLVGFNETTYVVPEPGTISLFALAAIGLLAGYLKKFIA